MTALAAPAHTPYRLFRARVARRDQLSPTFVRFTFTGDGLDQFGDDGPDQRIKVWVPAPGRQLPPIDDDDWYASYRAIAHDDDCGAIRTYTIRAVRPEFNEVDVDFVLHGVTGPASAWATTAVVDDEVALIGPNRAYGADCGGHEWKPPVKAGTVLIAGDETAAPAIARIVERLAVDPRLADTQVKAFIEVPESGDILDVPSLSNCQVTWLIRDSGHQAEHGDLLVSAVCDAASDTVRSSTVAAPADELVDVDVDSDLLWEVADPARSDASLYAWIAGEAGAVKAIRRHLVNDLGVDRRQVTFMGYWRRGRAGS